MNLYIDGDAVLKPTILKAINRLKINTKVIANKKITIGKSTYIEYIVVELGMDGADNHIVELVSKGDFVVTADIPLADKVVSKGANALDHRGALYTKENIKQYLAIRNLMDEIRSTGEILKGAKPFGQKDLHNFANSFNSFLAKNYKG
jgi:uncharacterized protein YaiI (UPF0178 family)